MVYKAIPGPVGYSIKNGDLSAATSAFAEIINAESQNGWIYHSMESLIVQEKVGCALNPQYKESRIYMLIFCHE